MKLVSVLLAAATLAVASSADADITKIQIISKGPAFGGYSFPGVGPYERIVGKGFGEVSPADRRNAVIVDVSLAPRNAKGKVEYAFDFYILKPVDLGKGNHKVYYEPPNRGGKTFGNAVSEVREAVDFLRYYAGEARAMPGAEALGPGVMLGPAQLGGVRSVTLVLLHGLVSFTSGTVRRPRHT